MLDFGTYTSYIWAAYGLSAALLTLLVVISCWQQRSLRTQINHLPAKKSLQP